MTCDIDEKMLFSNISQPRQKLLLRVSALLLNLCLLLYLSLSAGWSLACVSPEPGPLPPTSDTEDLAQHQPFSRGILNKYFGKLGIKTNLMSGSI